MLLAVHELASHTLAAAAAAVICQQDAGLSVTGMKRASLYRAG